MLQVDALTYAYPDTDVPALRDVSFDLAAGEVLLLAGGTGSGKSTLCYALAGFVPHFFNGEIEGDVRLEGRSMRASPLGEWVQHVGLVLQNPFNQISGARVTVFEEVAFGLENLGVPREEMGQRVQETLAQLGIAHLADRSPYALSGGQMQRVAIASILVLQPRLLVLDEPTAQLDPLGTEEVFAVLRDLVERGTTVVLATNKLADAAPLATRALVLRAGRVALLGDAQAVLGDPRLPEWDVEPPIYAPLAARLGLPDPLPVTFGAARRAFEAHPLTLTDHRADAWPFAPAAQSEIAPLESKIENRQPQIVPTPVVVEDVHFTYPSGVHALRGVSLRLEPARVTALIGSNGAGKSTLSRTLNGLLRPQRGTIRVGDWIVAEHPTSELARRVGYLFQNPDEQLFKASVAAEVAFGPQNLGWDEATVEAAVSKALALVGLVGYEAVHPYDLHPAERRWVALASVLALRGPVLILDEPTSGQDLAGQQRLAALLATLKARGYTLLLISHDMQFVADHADAVIVMAEGQVIAEGTPAAAFADETTLARADVAPPPVARLARALGLGDAVLTANGFVRAVVEADSSAKR